MTVRTASGHTASGRAPAGRRVMFATVLSALALAACDEPVAQGGASGDGKGAAPLPATAPMAAGPALPRAAAPPITALPAAAPRRDLHSYAHADRAYDLDRAADASPPDYGFAYGGVRPWAWRSGDGSTELAEPAGSGYRRYYHAPGADRPDLVRDGDYAYGYGDGSLAAVYGPGGGVLPPEAYRGRRADYAGRYLARGGALIAAAAVATHYGVSAGDWRQRRRDLSSDRERWRADHDRQDAREQRDDRARGSDPARRDDRRGPPPGTPWRDPDPDRRDDRVRQVRQDRGRQDQFDRQRRQADRVAQDRRGDDERPRRQPVRDDAGLRRMAGDAEGASDRDARAHDRDERTRRRDDAAQARTASAQARAAEARDRPAPRLHAMVPQLFRPDRGDARVARREPARLPAAGQPARPDRPRDHGGGHGHLDRR